MKNNKIRWLLLIFILVLIGGAFMYFYEYRQSTLSARQTMIHQRGSMVMPFNLSKTTHVFKKTNDGGIQQVIAKDKKDTQQISLIRMHLQMEASQFQNGDFADPTKLHGENMPGVQELSKGAKNMTITYTDLPNGGQITYTTANKDLINNIHTWFDAQLSDHGSDAMGM